MLNSPLETRGSIQACTKTNPNTKNTRTEKGKRGRKEKNKFRGKKRRKEREELRYKYMLVHFSKKKCLTFLWSSCQKVSGYGRNLDP